MSTNEKGMFGTLWCRAALPALLLVLCGSSLEAIGETAQKYKKHPDDVLVAMTQRADYHDCRHYAVTVFNLFGGVLYRVVARVDQGGAHSVFGLEHEFALPEEVGTGTHDQTILLQLPQGLSRGLFRFVVRVYDASPILSLEDSVLSSHDSKEKEMDTSECSETVTPSTADGKSSIVLSFKQHSHDMHMLITRIQPDWRDFRLRGASVYVLNAVCGVTYRIEISLMCSDTVELGTTWSYPDVSKGEGVSNRDVSREIYVAFDWKDDAIHFSGGYRMTVRIRDQSSELLAYKSSLFRMPSPSMLAISSTDNLHSLLLRNAPHKLKAGLTYSGHRKKHSPHLQPALTISQPVYFGEVAKILISVSNLTLGAEYLLSLNRLCEGGGLVSVGPPRLFVSVQEAQAYEWLMPVTGDECDSFQIKATIADCFLHADGLHMQQLAVFTNSVARATIVHSATPDKVVFVTPNPQSSATSRCNKHSFLICNLVPGAWYVMKLDILCQNGVDLGGSQDNLFSATTNMQGSEQSVDVLLPGPDSSHCSEPREYIMRVQVSDKATNRFLMKTEYVIARNACAPDADLPGRDQTGVQVSAVIRGKGKRQGEGSEGGKSDGEPARRGEEDGLIGRDYQSPDNATTQARQLENSWVLSVSDRQRGRRFRGEEEGEGRREGEGGAASGAGAGAWGGGREERGKESCRDVAILVHNQPRLTWLLGKGFLNNVVLPLNADVYVRHSPPQHKQGRRRADVCRRLERRLSFSGVNISHFAPDAGACEQSEEEFLKGLLGNRLKSYSIDEPSHAASVDYIVEKAVNHLNRELKDLPLDAKLMCWERKNKSVMSLRRCIRPSIDHWYRLNVLTTLLTHEEAKCEKKYRVIAVVRLDSISFESLAPSIEDLLDSDSNLEQGQGHDRKTTERVLVPAPLEETLYFSKGIDFIVGHRSPMLDLAFNLAWSAGLSVLKEVVEL